MSSLNGRYGGADGSLAGAGSLAAEGHAVSRFYSIVRRRFVRNIETAKPMRSGVGSLLAVGFIVCGLVLGAFTGGHGPALMAGIAGSVGLQASDIIISGQIETREQDVVEVLGLSETRSLVGFDAKAARERIAALPWVDEVTVRKLYPGKLVVEMREKRAFAVWQKDEHLSVVEQSGELISRFGISDLLNNRFSHLPHLIGEGAAETAGEILPLAADYPEIANRVLSYSRVGNRRWNVNLDGGLVVKLPEKNLGDALKFLASLQQERRVLDRQVATVDLRVNGRIALQLLPEAAEERAKYVVDRAKAMKKAERNL
ncbi:cell division protein FtsQ/DivIB [Pseudahrensia aquimaris]|uniref:Cell division protein FtsQ n=1 Tax=Pseudahrensia aquimaris TaxID=744461 RepID=A0ABW3FFL2_9HYPH